MPMRHIPNGSQVVLHVRRKWYFRRREIRDRLPFRFGESVRVEHLKCVNRSLNPEPAMLI
ncbi:hypothetical protein FE257_006683 [Aspergillus nanangensis]|uniref:Uncharacterized protein n=1 Tax=Aspergillus nanangensis TaxID=2582783 RepID=A0AAD4CPG3_ASPNN|nr:hypothetical protein FE257_006683 [Aspergillus nanangensis]